VPTADLQFALTLTWAQRCAFAHVSYACLDNIVAMKIMDILTDEIGASLSAAHTQLVKDASP
jgi:hypothetical protein